MEGLQEEVKSYEKAGRYLAEERKWINEVITRIDIVPDNGNYYEPLSVKPGFDFFYALINCADKVHRLQVLIPEVLYFNQTSYLIYNDERGRLKVQVSPPTEEFLKRVEKRVTYDIAENENEPAAVMRKATEHPCYTNVNLMTWRQTYESLS
jgi:hypothetical protein